LQITFTDLYLHLFTFLYKYSRAEYKISHRLQSCFIASVPVTKHSLRDYTDEHENILRTIENNVFTE